MVELEEESFRVRKEDRMSQTVCRQLLIILTLITIHMTDLMRDLTHKIQIKITIQSKPALIEN